MDNPYIDIHRSILAMCKNFLVENIITDFQVFDFDAHASINELPNNNLIGIAEYSVEDQKDMYMITCMVVVSTLADDNNIELLRNTVGKLFKKFKPGTTGEAYAVLDANGIKRGFLTVVDNTTVMPVARTETRPYQAIAVNFGVGYLSLP